MFDEGNDFWLFVGIAIIAIAVLSLLAVIVFVLSSQPVPEPCPFECCDDLTNYTDKDCQFGKVCNSASKCEDGIQYYPRRAGEIAQSITS